MKRLFTAVLLVLALAPGVGATTAPADDARPAGSIDAPSGLGDAPSGLGDAPSGLVDAPSGLADAPPALRNVGIDQRLGESLPLDAPFRDESGRAVTLADYFGTKPVVLVLTYFECPMLCTLVLNGLTKTLKTMSFEPGKEFDVVAVSFDPRDTPETATKKKATYVGEYGRAATAAGWHFLTGDEAAIARVAAAAGFRYRWVPEEKQFAHAAAIMVATQDGRLSRYFYGVDYAGRDLRLGLVEAADHKIGSAVDALLLFCYRYDPATGKYGWIALNLVRAGGVVTVLAIGVFMMVMFRREAGAEHRRHGSA